jgi:hypothetical protein
MERRGYIMKCPMPNQSKIWSQPLNLTRRTAPTVGFTVPKQLNPQGQESENSLPDVGFRTPSKFLKAPNGCVSTLYMRERLYEVKFPWSNVQIHLEKNQFADQVDRYGGMSARAHYGGAVKHYGPFTDFILEEKDAWASPDIPVCQIALPFILFTDDPEVWVDVVPSDRNPKYNLPIATVGGFMPIHAWTRGLSWAFEWLDTSVSRIDLSHDYTMFNLLFSKPVKLEYVEWTEDMSKQWHQIVNVSKNRRETNQLYPTALERRQKRLLPRKKWFGK